MAETVKRTFFTAANYFPLISDLTLGIFLLGTTFEFNLGKKMVGYLSLEPKTMQAMWKIIVVQ